jgi:hypothetical protein
MVVALLKYPFPEKLGEIEKTVDIEIVAGVRLKRLQITSVSWPSSKRKKKNANPDQNQLREEDRQQWRHLIWRAPRLSEKTDSHYLPLSFIYVPSVKNKRLAERPRKPRRNKLPRQGRQVKLERRMPAARAIGKAKEDVLDLAEGTRMEVRNRQHHRIQSCCRSGPKCDQQVDFVCVALLDVTHTSRWRLVYDGCCIHISS